MKIESKSFMTIGGSALTKNTRALEETAKSLRLMNGDYPEKPKPPERAGSLARI